VNDGDHIAVLTLECGVEVYAALDGSETAIFCQLGEHANIAVVFELDT
jgi:hypothetical protein